MAQAFHVSGVATVSVDGSPLGVCVDGIEITMQNFELDIYTDTFSHKTPQDVMDIGGLALVKCELVQYDDLVLTTVLSSFKGTAEGKIGVIGKLFNVQSGFHTLGITVSDVSGGEGNYAFGAVYLQDVASWKVGVRKTIYKLTFRALPDDNDVIYTVS